MIVTLANLNSVGVGIMVVFKKSPMIHLVFRIFGKMDMHYF